MWNDITYPWTKFKETRPFKKTPPPNPSEGSSSEGGSGSAERREPDEPQPALPPASPSATTPAPADQPDFAIPSGETQLGPPALSQSVASKPATMAGGKPRKNSKKLTQQADIGDKAGLDKSATVLWLPCACSCQDAVCLVYSTA